MHRLRPHREGVGRSDPGAHRMTGDVAIYSPHDDIRLLLRGLLRLHRFRVVREGSAPSELGELPDAERPVVVLDADLDEVSWSEAVRRLRERRPELRLVLLTPGRAPRAGGPVAASGVSAVVRRPFAVHELIEAVNGPPSPDARPPGGPSPG